MTGEDEPQGFAGRRGASEVVVATVFLSVAIAMVGMAFDFGPEARRLPFAVGLPLIAMAAANLGLRVALLVRGDSGGASNAATPAVPHAEERERLGILKKRSADFEQVQAVDVALSLLSILAWLLVLVVLLLFLGMVWATPIYMVLFMRVVGRQSWVVITLNAVLLTTCVYLLSNLLAVPTYGGVLSSYLPI